MAGICTERTSPNNCGHHNVSVTLDGEVFSFIALHDSEINLALSAEEKRQFVLWGIRRLRTVKGVTLDSLFNLVTHGDEATNVKVYDFVSPGSAVTVTDIGTVYRNVLPGAGVPVFIDCTGMTAFKFMFDANLIAAGAPYRVRIVRNSDGALFYESASIAATGEQALSTAWLTAADLGGAWPSWATDEALMRAEIKGSNGTADPVVRRLQLGVK